MGAVPCGTHAQMGSISALPPPAHTVWIRGRDAVLTMQHSAGPHYTRQCFCRCLKEDRDVGRRWVIEWMDQWKCGQKFRQREVSTDDKEKCLLMTPPISPHFRQAKRKEDLLIFAQLQQTLLSKRGLPIIKDTESH